MNHLSLADRAAAYNAAFPQWPDSHLHVGKRMVGGTWVLGNDYRNKSRLYGAYPPNYLRRILALFPDIEQTDMLHLFAGSVPMGTWSRFDRVWRLGEESRSMFTEGDAETDLPKTYGQGTFRLVLADPPYSPEDAGKYGTPMPNIKTVVREAAAITKPGGYMVWLSTVMPMYRKIDWTLVGAIGIVRSTNHRHRIATIFQRTQ